MKGFVIISGDDNAIPVIAYSSESNFATTGFRYIGISDWMKTTATRVHYIVTNNVQADAVTQNLWRSYAQGVNPQSTRAGGAVGPLCQTQWNQQPYYNALCPPAALPSTSNSKAVTGCVATAMAQIMKYWNYPAQGTGSHSYDDNGQYPYSVNYGTLSADFTRHLNWSAMPNTVSTNNSPVDSLMYELGVAVDMDYDSTGSGSYVLTTETSGHALKQFIPATSSIIPTPCKVYICRHTLTLRGSLSWRMRSMPADLYNTKAMTLHRAGIHGSWTAMSLMPEVTCCI
ncbi:unnamed protein product [Sphagnum jensenii]|uniref:Spi protease inhibitor domain-containing protein n=1 Tax=Sphagnum jensenii TaxID=128206 RepID=A0ABP0ZYA6_9BRYO